MRGAERIAAERKRQIEVEGWTLGWDANHASGELVLAARCYAEASTAPTPPSAPPTNWPWNDEWWKPSVDPIRNLVKAGALIAAEIDRLSSGACPQCMELAELLREAADAIGPRPSLLSIAHWADTLTDAEVDE